MTFCGNCATQLSAGAKFCGACGTLASGGAQTAGKVRPVAVK
jgi:hypothetical protein